MRLYPSSFLASCTTRLHGTVNVDSCLRMTPTYAIWMPSRRNTLATKGAQQRRKTVQCMEKSGLGGRTTTQTLPEPSCCANAGTDTKPELRHITACKRLLIDLRPENVPAQMRPISGNLPAHSLSFCNTGQSTRLPRSALCWNTATPHQSPS